MEMGSIALRCRIWFGVSGCWSRGSFVTGTKGRLFIMLSASQRNVCNVSSLNVCWVSKALRILRTLLIKRSHAPPKSDAPGGFQRHSMSRFMASRKTKVSCATRRSNSFFSSRSAPTKFVPLSDLRTRTFDPRLARKRRRAQMNESADKLSAISRCTARVAKHVKITPYRLVCVRPLLVWNGPNRSTPVLAHGCSPCCTLSMGRSAIICVSVGRVRFRQLMHLLKHLLTAALALVTQYFFRNSASTCCRPS